MHHNDMIKILQVNKLYYPWVGGVEKVVQDIAEGLKDRVDMKVLVCQPKGKGSIKNINGVEVIRASCLGIFQSMPISPSFPVLLNYFSKDRDIIHFHMPFPLADLSYMFKFKKSKKLVVWWHSDIVKQKKALLFYKPFMLSFLKKVDRIVVATPRHIESSIFLKKFKSKCEVIPFGINKHKFSVKVDTNEKVRIIREKYGGNIVLFIGRLIYYKGIEYLIEAMRKVDANLIIIGDGPLNGDLKNLVKKLEMKEKIFFLGSVDDADIISYYHACDVFVLPSIENTEAFGIVQMEAMACGKPVINTNLPTGVPYVSINKETGFTVPPRDSVALRKAINEIMFNQDLKRKFGHNAFKRVQNEFTLDVMMNRLYNVYESLSRDST